MPEGNEGGEATVTLETVAESVAGLRTAVEDMQEGRIDREQVEQIAAQAIEAAGHIGGYTPPAMVGADGEPLDVERELYGATPEERLTAVLAFPAHDTAAVFRTEPEAVEQFQVRCDNLLLMSQILTGQALQGGNQAVDPRSLKYYTQQFLPAMRGAVDTATSGEGQEWVPRELSANLIERVTLALRVLALFPEVSMPTNPYDIPALAVSRTRGGRHTEQTADSGQTLIKKITAGSRKVTLTAAKFATEILVSKEAEEDMIVPVLPLLRDELVDFTAADLEDTAINGDTTGTHRDADVTASDDPRKNWEGIRETAEDASSQRDHGGGDLSVAGLRANRKLMGKYGIDPGQLAHIVGMVGYIDLLSDANVITVDKYGPSATVLTGELGKVDGVPIIVSEYVRQDLNASGVQDGVTTTKTVAATVHRRAFIRGTRRQLTVEFLRELYSEADQDAVKVSTRQALTPRWGTQKAVAVSYNVDGT